MVKGLKYILYVVFVLSAVFLSFLGMNLGINTIERTTRKVDYAELKEYCHKNGLSENYAVVVDFDLHSGRHRFFACDLKKEQIVASSLCAHGVGKGSTPRKPVFSNEVGSLCSSLGHYKITHKHRMASSGVMSFRLEGLDATNSNAHQRGILIHSAKMISYVRWGIFPFYLPLDKRISSGCFAVDIDMMDIIDNLVKGENRAILLDARSKN